MEEHAASPEQPVVSQEEQKVDEKHEAPLGLSAELAQQFEQTAEQLIAKRKQTKPPSDYTSKKEVNQFKLSAEFVMQEAVKSL